MAFSIFASGSGRYSTRTRRRFADEGDIYDLADAIGHVASATGSNLGGQSDAHRSAMQAYGLLHAVHLLHNSLAFLAMEASDAEIWLLVHNPGTLWGVWDQPWHRNEKFYFSDSGDEFALSRDFLRCLHRCRVSKWGVMIGIARIIGEFTNHSGSTSSRRVILNMNIEV